MDSIVSARLKFLIALFLFAASTLGAVQPGDVIINEVYFGAPREAEKDSLQVVELLVVTDGSNLNGLQVSDRPRWNVPDKGQCTLQDSGLGFLSAVGSGTLLVIYNGSGTDDTNAVDHLLIFYAQSSLFCNLAPTGEPFSFAKAGDGMHLLHLGKQVDFVKYRVTSAPSPGQADPGKLNWENGAKGHINIGNLGDNVGFRFLGNKPELNDYLATWMPYSEQYKTANNLGQPNGGVNTEWVKALRTDSERARKD